MLSNFKSIERSEFIIRRSMFKVRCWTFKISFSQNQALPNPHHLFVLLFLKAVHGRRLGQIQAGSIAEGPLGVVSHGAE
jgi:hypothetical protein